MNDDQDLSALFARAAGRAGDTSGAYERVQSRITQVRKRRTAAWTGVGVTASALLVTAIALRPSDGRDVVVAADSTVAGSTTTTTPPTSPEPTASSTTLNTVRSASCPTVDMTLSVELEGGELVEAEHEGVGGLFEESSTRVVAMGADAAMACVLVATISDGAISIIPQESSVTTSPPAGLPIGPGATNPDDDSDSSSPGGGTQPDDNETSTTVDDETTTTVDDDGTSTTDDADDEDDEDDDDEDDEDRSGRGGGESGSDDRDDSDDDDDDD